MSNTSKLLYKASLLLLLGLPVFALAPIATITSDEPFLVNGRTVTVSGITSVPLTVGNEVATAASPVVLFFADGSSVKLAASSRAKLTGSDEQPKLVLLAGSLDYKVVLGSNLSVTSLDLERKAKPVGKVGQPVLKSVSTTHPTEATLSVVTH
jgi:hypothetical protein